MNKEIIIDQAASHFDAITGRMKDTFVKKNQDYGNSFERSLDEDGLLVLKIRLGDKFNRLSRLVKDPTSQLVMEETLLDTLLDLANYAVLGIMWIEKNNKK